MSTDLPADAVPAALPAELPAELPVQVPPPVRGLVGPYEILIELAAGGMASVYLARAIDGRAVAPLVAVKRPHRHLASDKNYLAMLLDEARLASAIDHPNVVKVRELRFEDCEPSIVMDYIEGASLAELMKEIYRAERALDLKVALRIVLDALAGLRAAHELCDATGKPLGIVHRDVSPHNVLIGTDGVTRLTDFGIANAEGRFQSTRTHEVKGKLAYLAPERVDRRRMCTQQSDIFSMAIVLWECLAGRRLFRGDQAVDTLQEVMLLPIPRLRQIGVELSGALDDVIARGLSRDLEVRYATAQAFGAALADAAGASGIAEPPQVTQLLETIYGARMALRHEQVRAVLDDDVEVERLFAAAGLASRHSEADPHQAELLEAIAPPAPSERYVFGTGLARFPAPERPTRWALVAGVAAGVVLGAFGTVALARSHSFSPIGTPVAAASLAPSGTSPASSSPAPSPWATSTTRHVVFHLPFLATHIAIDGLARELLPATDVVPIDLPMTQGASHQVTVTAFDGSSTNTQFVERDGEARVVTEGPPLVATSSPTSSPRPNARRAPLASSPRQGGGVVHNGFTKLK